MKKSQTVKEYETAKRERGRELEDENLINIKKKKCEYAKKQREIEQRHESAPAGQHPFLSPSLLALSSSFPFSLSLWD